MTKREMFAQVIAMAQGETVSVSTEEMVAFATHEIELLARKGSGSRKPTAKQLENEGFKAAILEILEAAGEPLTIAAIMADPRLEGLTNQRVSALITLLKHDGLVVRTEVKKKAHFAVV